MRSAAFGAVRDFGVAFGRSVGWVPACAGATVGEGVLWLAGRCGGAQLLAPFWTHFLQCALLSGGPWSCYRLGGQVMSERPVRVVCGHCGSEEVTRDAWAAWDIERQDWLLAAVYDYAYCHKCEGGARIEDVPLPPSVAPAKAGA